MKNFLSFLGLLVGVAALVSACHNPPKYPIEPNINYRTVEQYHFTQGGRAKDSLVIVTPFEDGDGDLGLTDDDNEPPFNAASDNMPQGAYFHNYFIKVFIKRVGQSAFETYNFPDIAPGVPNRNGLNGRFFPLAPDGRTGPLEGDLKYGFVIRPNRDFAVGDALKFEIYIVDRQLHESNRITTDEVILFR